MEHDDAECNACSGVRTIAIEPQHTWDTTTTDFVQVPRSPSARLPALMVAPKIIALGLTPAVLGVP